MRRIITSLLLTTTLSHALWANTALYLSYEAWVLRQQQHDARLAQQPTQPLKQRVVQLPLDQLLIATTQAMAPLSGPIQVNINRADRAELDAKLLGVGAKKAQAIVDYRQQHGDFKRPQDLQRVKGIGEKTFEKNQDRIKIRD